MKKVIISIVFLILFCNFVSDKRTFPCLRIKLKVISKEKSTVFLSRSGAVYTIQIKLINNTDSTIRYWMMSCAWQDNWVFESKLLELVFPGCDSNAPWLFEIKPGKDTLYNGILHVKNLNDSIKNENLRIGFIFIRDNAITKMEMWSFDRFDQLIKERKEIIWSEPFKLK
jgi:hypothetical protein